MVELIIVRGHPERWRASAEAKDLLFAAALHNFPRLTKLPVRSACVTILSLQLTIEKLVYGGDGLARVPADAGVPLGQARQSEGRQGKRQTPRPGPGAVEPKGKAVFVPFVLAGERVEARAEEDKPGFVRARAEQILSPSPERVLPGCRYYQNCGGCHYQHAGYEHQLEIKREILRETVSRLARIQPPTIRAHASPPWHYRNRTRLKVRAGLVPEGAAHASVKPGTSFALGYYRFNSHELLPVEECPISSVLINRAIGVLWQLGRAGAVSGAVREIEFFANAEDTRLLVELSLADSHANPSSTRRWTMRSHPSLVDFIAEFRHAMPEISGVAIFRQAPATGTAPVNGTLVREEIPEELKQTFGDDELVYRARSCEFHVGAGSFFQTNRYLADTLIELVTADRYGQRALDLYAGAGLFTLPLSQNFRQVGAVEAAPFSFRDLRRNTPPSVRSYRDTTEKFLARSGAEWREPLDLVVVDPPRTGLGETSASELLRRPIERLTYVSCDPATLARDLRVLVSGGFRIEQMDLVDLFPQTFHIESVTQLLR